MADPLRIVLAAPRNPLNIGAAARAMSNFGFNDLRLANPYDVAYHDAKSAVNAQHVLARSQVYPDIAAALDGCTLVVGTTALGHRDLHVPLYRLEAGATLLREHMQAGGQAALLFGSEKFGLSNGEMSHCHWLMRIPTRTEHSSMNLGQAVAICLYELRRDAAEATPPLHAPPEAATAEEQERLTTVLLDLLLASGYIPERTVGTAELKLRRLIRRLRIPAHDAEILLGMFRQIQWKVRQGK